MPHYGDNKIIKKKHVKLYENERVRGVSVIRLYTYVPKNKTRFLSRIVNYASWNLFSTIAGLLACKVDLVFVPSPPLTNGITGTIVSKIRRVPFVYNVQDIYPDIAIRLGILKDPLLISVFRELEILVYTMAKAVSVISDGFRLNLLSKGVPEAKLRVIPNFVDTDFMHPLPRNNRFSEKRGLNNRFVVLFAGNVGLSQALDKILDAAALLSNYQDILFLIVGNGASKPYLVEIAGRRKLENVIFLPFLPYEDVPEMYGSSDVCLVPLKQGLAEESVPSKIFSILGAAKPLIASVDTGSDTYRLVQEAECGLCIKPEDPQALAEAVKLLYHNREMGIRMGSNGRKFVEENFSRQKIARRYEELFIRVVNRGV